MREHGLPAGYAGALEDGLWPSCDVLLLWRERYATDPGSVLAPHTSVATRSPGMGR